MADINDPSVPKLIEKKFEKKQGIKINFWKLRVQETKYKFIELCLSF